MAIKTIQFQTADETMVTAARAVAQKLNRAGFQAFFAGGSVRDALLERPVKDIDIATSATPDQVETLFAGHTVAVGKAFGVVLVLHGGFQFDVATFRTDGAYADGRHPENVTFATAEGDAQRRDFTVNGLFCDPASGNVVDYVGGLADLAAQVIRTIGEPEARFREDHLRMLRAIRFASVLGFGIEAATFASVKEHAARIKLISAERIARELIRLVCESPRPSIGLNLLRETGLLAHVLPEVAALYGTEQPPQFHPEGDVWTHTCLMLDELAAPREPVLALAVLLHDIGKPVTCCRTSDPATGETRLRFPNHAGIGAELAESVLLRLRQPSARVAEVKALVLGHMHFVEAMKMRRAKVRRFLGMKHFPRMLELMRLDIRHSNKDFTTWQFLKEAFETFTSEPVLPEPLVHGRDLIAWGVPPGPEMGRLLNELYDAQLEGRITSITEAQACFLHSGCSGK
ncbi:MAG: CCA tRNA nucleotidyltransferase [bacterium]